MKPELKYGLICGVCMCAWIGLGHRLGLHTLRPEIATYAGLLSNLVPLVTLFLMLRARRARVYDGRLSLGSGIVSGMYASLVAALIVYSFLVVYTHFINPTWVYEALDPKVAAWRAQQVAETEIQGRITLYLKAYTPVGLLWTTLVNMTLMGGVFSLILTLVVRRLPHTAA